jgi:hypothetical protein
MANALGTTEHTIDFNDRPHNGIDAIIKAINVEYDTLGGDLEIHAAPGASRHLAVLAIVANMSTAGRHILQYGATPTVITAIGHSSNNCTAANMMDLRQLQLLALLPANQKFVYQGNQAWTPKQGVIWIMDAPMATYKKIFRKIVSGD